MTGRLVAEGVVAGYSAADTILKGVSLRVEPGEVVSIIGPNGAGKSTFFKIVAGLLAAREGRVRFDGADIHRLDARAVAERGIALVPQERNIFPSMSVQENLEMGGFMQPASVRRRIESIYVRFPELADKRRHAARTLSGGQRQILAMATALMVDPKLLLLDEPSAGLSPGAAERLFETILAINRGERLDRDGRAECAGGAEHLRSRLYPRRRTQPARRRRAGAGGGPGRAARVPRRLRTVMELTFLPRRGDSRHRTACEPWRSDSGRPPQDEKQIPPPS